MRAAPKDHAFLLIMAARILRTASFLFGERWNSVPLYCYKGLPFFFFFFLNKSLKMGNIFLRKITKVAQVLSCTSWVHSHPTACLQRNCGVRFSLHLGYSLRGREGEARAWALVTGGSYSGLSPLTIFQEE